MPKGGRSILVHLGFIILSYGWVFALMVFIVERHFHTGLEEVHRA
jgi:hypothetical protein